MKTLNVKPSKPASVGVLIGVSFMIVFGIGFAVLVGSVLVDNEAPIAMSIVFYVFMIGWEGTAIFILVYHILNLKRAKGLPLVEIETEPDSQADHTNGDPMQRLRDLEGLKRDGIINEDEFRRKREEILQQKW